jgi:hypothetical protein
MKFLYIAYAATWVIHLVYLGFVSRGFRKLRDEVRERSSRATNAGD